MSTEAYRLALARLREAAPFVVAAKAGVDFDGKRWVVPFFNRTYHVEFPHGRVEGSGGGIPTIWLQVLLMHYLLGAGGTPMADRWVSCRDLPGGYFVSDDKFDARSGPPLVRLYGQDPDGLAAASQALGGIPMPGVGDMAYRFLALPRLPLAVVMYFQDEEMPGSARVLFDASAGQYLPTDDLIDLGIYFSLCLQSHKVPDMNPEQQVI
ncbi:MAG: DUF3786 domain-containing protein [Chloroflexi bacterium]|nr:DUF3786 domain-containing protein [Chloroflexota bacterium]